MAYFIVAGFSFLGGAIAFYYLGKKEGARIATAVSNFKAAVRDLKK